MPLWSATAVVTGLNRLEPVTVFDAEALSDGEESIAVAIPPRPGKQTNISFTIRFDSGTPTTVDYQLQVAVNNVDAEYYDIGSSMVDTAGGKVTINGIVARFARIIANDADTETVTAQILVD